MKVCVRDSDGRVMRMNYNQNMPDATVQIPEDGYTLYLDVDPTPEIDSIVTAEKRGIVFNPGDFVEITYDGGSLSVLDNMRFIELTTDAEDTHQPYDGIPDIPADGTSQCNIFIKKKKRDGSYCTESSDDDQIDISCTRGKLNIIRTNLVNGEATVILTSISETCVSTIYALGSSEGSFLDQGEIEIQFAPTS